MRFVLIVLVAVLGFAAVMAAALPWLAEPALRAGLRLAALDDVDFERLRLGWDDLELEGITLGQAGQELARLRVAWRLPALLDGRLERIEIEGLVVRAAWRDGRLQLAGIESTDGADGPLLPIPDIEEAVVGNARLELSTGLGTLRLPFSGQIQAIGEQLAFEATIDDARLGGIEGAISASGTIEGDLPRDTPIAIEAAQATANVSVVADNAKLGSAQGIDGEAQLALDLAQGQWQVETSIADAAWQGATLGEARIELTAEGSVDAVEGTLDLTLSDAGWAVPDLAVSGASLRQRLDWSLTTEILTLRAAEPGALGIASLKGPDFLAGPLRLRLEPGDRPLLELTLDEGRPADWRHSVSAVFEALEADLAAPAPLQLRSEAGTISLALEGFGQTVSHARLGLAAGALQLPEHALALDGIATSVGLTSTGLATGQTVPISIERIGHTGRPAWFAPFALQGELEPGPEAIAFEGTLRRIAGGLRLTVRGESRGFGSGRATVELAPVTFGPGLQPKDLAPIAGDPLSDVAGDLALNGDLTWGDAGLAGNLVLLIDQLGLTVGPARLEQVNGVVRLDRIWPPSTPPGQQLAIGLLDLGLPLTSGITTFQLVPGPRIELAELEWRLAGGTARAEPFSLGSELEGSNVTLRAEQLDLGQLLALTRLDGLTGEGSLDGVLPVRLSEGAAIIENGELAAIGPGVLRYAAGAAPAALQAGGEGVDLLLQALENFHYDELKITLDGRTDAAMDIGLHLRGANPDLYDGHPVEFNLDVEGELGNILRQGVASYQIPDRIRERMQGFDR